MEFHRTPFLQADFSSGSHRRDVSPDRDYPNQHLSEMWSSGLPVGSFPGGVRFFYFYPLVMAVRLRPVAADFHRTPAAQMVAARIKNIKPHPPHRRIRSKELGTRRSAAERTVSLMIFSNGSSTGPIRVYCPLVGTRRSLAETFYNRVLKEAKSDLAGDSSRETGHNIR